MAKPSQSGRSDQIDQDNSSTFENGAPSELPGDLVDPGEGPQTSEKPDNDGRGEDGFIQQPIAEVRKEEGPFLIGISDDAVERRVTEADFASVGIQQSTLVFEWKKGYRLPLKGINPVAVQFLVDKEYGFSISDE